MLDLSKLINDPIRHDLTWSLVLAKLHSNIPKFEGNSGEDIWDHVTTFHLWCSSSSLNVDYVWLRLFQRTLTGVAHKWYIELPFIAYHCFHDLATIFLNHFQLPIQFDVDIELLYNFR